MDDKYDKAVPVDVTSGDVAFTGNDRPKALLVGVAGNVKVDFQRGPTGTTLYLAAGMIHRGLRIKKVYQTGTAATGIVALY